MTTNLKSERKVEYDNNVSTVTSLAYDPSTFEKTLVLQNDKDCIIIKECDDKIKYLDEVDESCIVSGDSVLYEGKEYVVKGKLTCPTNIREHWYVLYNDKKEFIKVSPQNVHKMKKKSVIMN